MSANGDKESPPSATKEGVAASQPSQLLNQEEDAMTSKYRKLLILGVPAVAVRHKMKQAGIDSRVISEVVGEEENEEEDEVEEDELSSAALSVEPEIHNPDEHCSTYFKEWDITVDPRNPTLAWEASLKNNLPELQTIDVRNDDNDGVHTENQPRPDGHSRWVCISDTHGAHCRMTHSIPEGDVLIHAGDFTRRGSIAEIKEFCEWMTSLPHKYKIVIAGNHELTLDPTFDGEENYYKRFYSSKGVDDGNEGRQIIRSCNGFTYLEDASIQVLGYNVYGSPWQPEFCNWAFNLSRGPECARAWREIPTDTDILVTHGPSVGHGDLCSSGLRAGCVDLLQEVLERIRPSHHIFGHIHEGYGCTKMGDSFFLNASTCTFSYRPSNPPLVFDLPPNIINNPV